MRREVKSIDNSVVVHEVCDLFKRLKMYNKMFNLENGFLKCIWFDAIEGFVCISTFTFSGCLYD